MNYKMELENEIICVLSEIGIKIEKLDDAKGLFIEREQLLCDKKYEEVKKLIPKLLKIIIKLIIMIQL